MRLKYKLMLGIIVVCMGICLFTYQSYALWVVEHTGKENVVEVGCFKINYEELTSSIALNNTYPMSDAKGMSGDAYTFKITNKCTVDSSYSVTLNTLTTNGLKPSQMKYAIYKDGEEKPSTGSQVSILEINQDKENLNVTNLDESYVLTSGILKGAKKSGEVGESVTYNLYIWIDQNVGNEAMNQTFEASVNIVNAATTVETPLTAAEKIAQLEKKNPSQLAYDGTEDNNLRYIGANPNNYVVFNGEKWRIIGAMNNVDDGEGTKETRLKIIRDEPVGAYPWDGKMPGVGSCPAGPSMGGSGDWTDSQLMMFLNTSTGYPLKEGYQKYGNQIIGVNQEVVYEEGCAPGGYNGCNEASFILNDEAKQLIGEAYWNLGGMNDGSAAIHMPYSEWYSIERGTTPYNGIPTSWIGSVALMYPSDYIYSTSGNETISREICLENGSRWNIRYGDENCANNSWLYKSSDHQLTLTVNPMKNATSGFVIDADGPISNYSPTDGLVSPVVYLKSNVMIAGGDGSSENPFILK